MLFKKWVCCVFVILIISAKNKRNRFFFMLLLLFKASNSHLHFIPSSYCERQEKKTQRWKKKSVDRTLRLLCTISVTLSTTCTHTKWVINYTKRTYIQNIYIYCIYENIYTENIFYVCMKLKNSSWKKLHVYNMSEVVELER